MSFITLTKRNIYKLYHDSELYNLIESDDEFNIPSDYYIETIKIDSINDFIYMCNIVNYWGFKRVPIELYLYVFKNNIDLTQLNEELCNSFTIEQIVTIIKHVKELYIDE